MHARQPPPTRIALWLKGRIGKGSRSAAVKQALQDYEAVYFGSTGGRAALLSTCILEARVLAFAELEPGALRELQVKDFPLLVLNDALGGDLHAVPNRTAALLLPDKS